MKKRGSIINKVWGEISKKEYAARAKRKGKELSNFFVS